MQQRLHLLIVDRARRAALAARFGTRWLLPSIACGERVRAGPLVARWCAERSLARDVAGQWLGRVDTNGADWLMAIPARTPSPQAVTPLEWIALDFLANCPSVIDYQSWALARALARHTIPAVDGPFGSLDWPEQVRAWIAASLGSPPCAWTPYRISAHEVVLGVETARGRAYFKGLSGDRAAEAHLTRRLAALAPESFAPTLALVDGADGTVWWLTGECAGRPTRDAALIGVALARIQQRIACAVDLQLPDIDLGSAAQWACAGSSSTLHARLIRDACASAERASLRRTWIPMDLDPTNVMVHDGDVRFIDVDDSFRGPAPLAIALFARRCGGLSAYRAYERSWSPPLESIDWQRVEIAAEVFAAWRGWQRLKLNVERGEVDASLDQIEARVRRRLARALYGR